MPNVTWKSVLLIWLIALPFLGGVGFILYKKDARPFNAAAAWTQRTAQTGVKAVQDYQKREAAKKAAEEKAQKEAAAAKKKPKTTYY
ncbi:hypothetical protein D3C72_684700 [compost metagenome]|jgi:hypothetical protein